MLLRGSLHFQNLVQYGTHLTFLRIDPLPFIRQGAHFELRLMRQVIEAGLVRRAAQDLVCLLADMAFA